MELSFTEAQRDFNEDTWYLQKALYDVNALKTLPVSRDLQTQLRHRLHTLDADEARKLLAEAEADDCYGCLVFHTAMMLESCSTFSKRNCKRFAAGPNAVPLAPSRSPAADEDLEEDW